MATFEHAGKKYKVDPHGFLVNPEDWDEDFAEGMAPRVKIKNGLTDEHWRFINFVRSEFDKMKVCPLVYVACRDNEIGLGDLRALFPTGYLRGVCRLAGITYREGMFQHYWLEENIRQHEYVYSQKTYEVDVHGCLVDWTAWDENFAVLKSYEMKMPDYLTPEHWDLLTYVREFYGKKGVIPTIYETCEQNALELSDLERLFPDGYHRGLIKIAGLRARE